MRAPYGRLPVAGAYRVGYGCIAVCNKAFRQLGADTRRRAGSAINQRGIDLNQRRAGKNFFISLASGEYTADADQRHIAAGQPVKVAK